MTEGEQPELDQIDEVKEIEKTILSERARQSVFRMIMDGPPASLEQTHHTVTLL
jgi:hypothetical protein